MNFRKSVNLPDNEPHLEMKRYPLNRTISLPASPQDILSMEEIQARASIRDEEITIPNYFDELSGDYRWNKSKLESKFDELEIEEDDFSLPILGNLEAMLGNLDASIEYFEKYLKTCQSHVKDYILYSLSTVYRR